MNIFQKLDNGISGNISRKRLKAENRFQAKILHQTNSDDTLYNENICASLIRGVTKNVVKTLRDKGIDCFDQNLAKKFERNITEQDIKDIWEKQKGRCFWTNIPLKPIYNNKPFQTQAISVDRLNNNLGYTKENVVLCLRGINLMRGAIPQSEFKNQLAILIENLKEYYQPPFLLSDLIED